jgi:hypothetical protein
MRPGMKYRLVTKLPPSDEASNEPFNFSEKRDADIYLRSLAEDIQGLAAVKSVTRHGFVFEIHVEDKTTQRELKEAMKPYFSRDRFDVLRYVSLEPS